MTLNARRARFIFQRTELTEHGRDAGRKAGEESRQPNEKQRMLLFFFSHRGTKGISSYFSHLRCCH